MAEVNGMRTSSVLLTYAYTYGIHTERRQARKDKATAKDLLCAGGPKASVIRRPCVL